MMSEAKLFKIQKFKWYCNLYQKTNDDDDDDNECRRKSSTRFWFFVSGFLSFSSLCLNYFWMFFVFLKDLSK